MVDKQSNTLLINSVMRWMSFSVLSNKEILSGVNVISPKHRSTLKHWKVAFRSAWKVVVVRSKGSETRFRFQPRRCKKSPNPKLSEWSFFKPKPHFRAQVDWVEIFVKTNGQNPQKQLLITNPVVVHRINWLYFLSLIPFEAGISIFSFALVIDFSTPNKERNPNVTP